MSNKHNHKISYFLRFWKPLQQFCEIKLALRWIKVDLDRDQSNKKYIRKILQGMLKQHVKWCNCDISAGQHLLFFRRSFYVHVVQLELVITVIRPVTCFLNSRCSMFFHEIKTNDKNRCDTMSQNEAYLSDSKAVSYYAKLCFGTLLI